MQKIRITESELKSMICEAVKKVIKESRGWSSVCYLDVNGKDFVQKTLEKFGIGTDPSYALNDEIVAEIMGNKFHVKAIASHSPQTYMEPGGDDFEITEDDGLYDMIDSIQDEALKNVFLKGYDEFVESNPDYEYPLDPNDPEDRADYYHDRY